METQKILQADVLDIIFDNRNKAYGAYELRRNYGKRIRNGFASIAAIVLFGFSLALFTVLSDTKVVASPSERPVEFIPYVPIEDIPKPKEPEAPVEKQPEVKTPQTIPTEIVEAVEVKDPPKEKEPETIPSVPVGDPEGSNPMAGNPNPNPGGGGGQGGETPIIPETKEPEIPETIMETYDLQEVPEYPGGEDEMRKYLLDHIKYPTPALEHGVSGRVTLGFIVDKNGQIDEIKILRSVGYGCDEEAIRVVKEMPNWKPGKNNGKPVKVYFNLPITFEVQ